MSLVHDAQLEKIRCLLGNHLGVLYEQNEDTLRHEYPADLIRSGVHGKYASRYQEGRNVVAIDPDLHKIFPDSESINCALHQYAEVHQISQA